MKHRSQSMYPFLLRALFILATLAPSIAQPALPLASTTNKAESHAADYSRVASCTPDFRCIAALISTINVIPINGTDYLWTSLPAFEIVANTVPGYEYRLGRGQLTLEDGRNHAQFLDLTCTDLGTQTLTLWILDPTGRLVDFCFTTLDLQATENCANFESPPDVDGDKIFDFHDNCAFFNPGQNDINVNSIGDVCDCTASPSGNSDIDGDGVCDALDQCPNADDFDKLDIDGDCIGDVCDCNDSYVTLEFRSPIPETMTCNEATNFIPPLVDVEYEIPCPFDDDILSRSSNSNRTCIDTWTGSGTKEVPDACTGGTMLISYPLEDLCGNVVETLLVAVTVEPANTIQPFLQEIPQTMSCSEAEMYVPPLAYYDNVGSTTFAESQLNASRIDLANNCEDWGSVSGTILEQPGACGGSMIIEYIFPSFCSYPEFQSRVEIIVDPAPLPTINLPEMAAISCSEAASFSPPPATYTNDSFTNLEPGCVLTGSVQGVLLGTFDGICGGTKQIIYSGTDICGRDLEEKTTTIEVLPATEPTWINPPGDVSVSCADLPLDGSGKPHWPTSDLSFTNGESGICEIAGTTASMLNGVLDCCGSTLTETWMAERCATVNTRSQSESIFYTRTITITADDTRPTLHDIPADVTIACGDDLPPWPTNVTATDNLDSDIEITRREVPGFARCGGNFFERIFTAVDGCGNERSAKYTISLVDNIKPELTIPDDLILECGVAIPEPTYMVTDNCSQVDIDFTEVRTDQNVCEYTLVRTWRARDACGNTQEKLQTIIVIDEEAPQINIMNPMLANLENGGDLVMYGCDAPQALMTDVTVTDNCCSVAPASLIVEDVKVGSNHCDVFDFHERWRCDYTATDAVGNISNFHFYVLLYDTTAPVLSHVPADVVIDSSSQVPPFDTTVTAIDNCLGKVPLAVASSIIENPDHPDQQMIGRSWSAEDACGNLSVGSQQILIGGFDPNMMTSAIGNRVWHDENNNGRQDVGEIGLNDIRLNLYRLDASTQRMTLHDSTITRSNEEKHGVFLFDQLFPGTYQVEILPDAGMVLTDYGVAVDSLDSDANPETNMTNTIRLDSQMTIANIDFGLRRGNLEPEVIFANTDRYALQVEVYPNPFRDELKIDLGQNWQQFRSGKIVDKLGQVILELSSSEIQGSTHEVSLQNVSSGHYFLQLQFEREAVVKRVVKL